MDPLGDERFVAAKPQREIQQARSGGEPASPLSPSDNLGRQLIARKSGSSRVNRHCGNIVAHPRQVEPGITRTVGGQEW